MKIDQPNRQISQPKRYLLHYQQFSTCGMPLRKNRCFTNISQLRFKHYSNIRQIYHTLLCIIFCCCVLLMSFPGSRMFSELWNNYRKWNKILISNLWKVLIFSTRHLILLFLNLSGLWQKNTSRLEWQWLQLNFMKKLVWFKNVSMG